MPGTGAGSGSENTAACLARWHQGKAEGLNLLLARHLPWILKHIRERLGAGLRKKLDSSDIVQDAILEFLQYGPRFVMSDTRQFRGLLAKIVENVLRDKHDWFTARRRTMALERPLPTDTILHIGAGRNEAAHPSAAVERREEEAWIRLAVELLDAPDRDVLVLRQWDHLSFADIGKRLGISPDAAWMRHKRAVARLGKKVGELRRGEVDFSTDGGRS